MHLANFIENHQQKIVDEWIDFAGTLRPFDRNTDFRILQDSVVAMLHTMVRSIAQPETPQEEFEKSRGHADANAANPSAAWGHGLERLESGLDINQMVAEFRALRAVVLRLYKHEEPTVDLAEVMRFDEAIDQSIAESLAAYTRQLDKLRNTLLAVLAHDLRGPLQAILISGEAVDMITRQDERVSRLMGAITRGAVRIRDLIDDFLAFLTPMIGGDVPIERELVDMVDICRHMVAEVNATQDTERLELQSHGNTQGEWDRARVEQILSNLLRNAVEHGAPGKPVVVTINGNDAGVNVSVHNDGEPIPPEATTAIFKPLVQLDHQNPRQHEHLGLGLFIAKELVERHSGRIGFTSSRDTGTTFWFFLPHGAAD